MRATGEHLRNSCGKRSREGRKETNRKLSMRSRMKRTGNQPWMKGKSEGDARKRIGRGQAEGESGRQALVEQLWERSEEGRKETNRKPSTRTWKEGMRNQAGEKGETEEAKAEAGTGEAAVRRNREERKGRNRG